MDEIRFCGFLQGENGMALPAQSDAFRSDCKLLLHKVLRNFLDLHSFISLIPTYRNEQKVFETAAVKYKSCERQLANKQVGRFLIRSNFLQGFRTRPISPLLFRC